LASLIVPPFFSEGLNTLSMATLNAAVVLELLPGVVVVDLELHAAAPRAITAAMATVVTIRFLIALPFVVGPDCGQVPTSDPD